MIWGRVSANREARLRLRVRGPDGTEKTVGALIDTGYSMSLTLPDAVIASLGLPYHSDGDAVLADGSAVEFDNYSAEVWWGDSWRPVVVSAVGGEVLLGMWLLLGHELRVAVVPGGAVEISPLA